MLNGNTSIFELNVLDVFFKALKVLKVYVDNLLQSLHN